MAYEMNNGDLSLFVNDRKESDRHPDYKGKALIEGTLYDVAVWRRTDRNGNEYFSGKISVRQMDGAPSQEGRYIAGARQLAAQRNTPADRREIYRNPPRQDTPLYDDPHDDLPFD